MALLVVALFLVVAPGRANAQNSFQPWLIQSNVEIARVVGNEAKAAALIGEVLVYLLGQSSRTPKEIAVHAFQIPADWLPKIPGVKFVRLSDFALNINFRACGTYIGLEVVSEPRESPVHINVLEEPRCLTHIASLEFVESPTGWQLESAEEMLWPHPSLISVERHCGCS
ncbi:MAG: hypothetical protein AB7P22_08915 [Vicinamibacterales bacterium]